MTINSLQRKTLVVAALLFVASGVCPPWIYTVNGQSFHSERPAGYALVMKPPEPMQSNLASGVKLDFSRLVVQWLVLAALTGGVLLLEERPRVV